MISAIAMLRLARWHIWLGWLAGLPLLLWIASGLFMAARPIDEVRGEHLRAPPPAIATAGLVLPEIFQPISGAELVQQSGGPAWIVTGADGSQWRQSALDGSVIPPVIEDEARQIAKAAYRGAGRLEAVTYFPADAAPADLRRAIPAWQARFSDGTHIYVSDYTGEIVAFRTRWWRAYDLMWGVHIMDLETRENAHNPLLITFAAIALVSTLFGVILLFRRRKARRAA